ncbi:formyl transferase [Bordetella bronchiseptica]|nr:formyl transferase [Bordetella bronchiseptica]
MKFAAIGRHEALLHTIDMLVEAGHQLSYILTAKEAPEYSAGVVDFERKGRQFGVPVYVTPRLTPEWVDKMRQHAVDIAVSLNFPTVIERDAIGVFPFGILNAHGGDLPRYRGNACQAWALINAEPEIGLCVHKMVGGSWTAATSLQKICCRSITTLASEPLRNGSRSRLQSCFVPPWNSWQETRNMYCIAKLTIPVHHCAVFPAARRMDGLIGHAPRKMWCVISTRAVLLMPGLFLNMRRSAI